jgi:diguanylate cyclase (GGDEF)-like protein
MAGTLTDVTWRQTCDALTGIPNRLAFLDSLERRIEIARETGDWAFSVFFLDLDRFKSVNESLGHAGGDALLAETSRRIGRVTQQAAPCSLVARNGGDEFLILAEGTHSGERANELYLALERSLKVPFDFRGSRVTVSASIGFAMATESCLHPEDLITDAETAMSQAKNEGKGRCVAFTVGLRERATTRRQLEEDLRCAIESGQMVMHYQPEVDLRTGRTIGFEALVRWQHPQRGLISPGDFIPIAEETGLILPLGYWGLTEACRQILRWRSESTDFDDLRMSVNLSAKQFTESGLVQRVEEVLQQTGLDPCDLRLEVTESSLMSNAEQAVVTMKDLRALGVGLHMDDFGTGYSSLQYLQRFPFDMLKIDRSFIKQICENKESSKIVRTILDLARSLVMDVVAEGIETEAQMRALKGLGCRFGQGYYFSKPQDSATISRSLSVGSQDSDRPALLTMDPRSSIGHA